MNGDADAGEAEFVLLDRDGGGVTIEADGDATLLVLSGEPIDEPIVVHGPFVMNTPGRDPPGDRRLHRAAASAR